MQLPFFYQPADRSTGTDFHLDEDTSRHVIQVLRMKAGEQLNLTDGAGTLLTVSITEEHKKHCGVQALRHEQVDRGKGGTFIGISLLKNASRFEWFLEKSVEIGVRAVVPLLCSRTEKERVRADRFRQIMISAMLQSRQCWLPVLHKPVSPELLLQQEEIITIPQRYIAHCLEDSIRTELTGAPDRGLDRIILIGPEGDFTASEVETALTHQFQPVSLGDTRLRTETAGMVAAVLLR